MATRAPTLLGLAFFRQVVELQQPFRGVKEIKNALQTNGRRLTDDWCAFFKANNFFIGISLDGPKDIHDRHWLGMAGQAAAAGQPAAQRLVGRWVRPDGGYVLAVQEVKKDGSLKAAYFNPRPINVGKAELRRKEAKLTVFVELGDVHYPGSTYTLQYDPASDRLKGRTFRRWKSRPSPSSS
jgi:hypothetical protein